MTPELTVLALAAILQAVQFTLYSVTANLQVGPKKAMSPRDQKIELTGGLFVIEPEWDVDMHPHRAVFIIARSVFQRRDLAGNAGSDRVHQIAPDLSGPIGQPAAIACV